MKILRKDVLKWTAVILVLLIIPYGSGLLVFIFTFLFFRKKIYNIDLLILYFLIFLIQSMGGGDGDSSVKSIRYLLIFISFFQTVGQRSFSYRPLFKRVHYFLVPFIFILIHSLIYSYDHINSLFELISFSTLIFFTYKSTYFENRQQQTRLINNIEAMYIAFIITSAISFVDPSISYLRNGVGFQGVSNQPNALGIVMAPYCGFLFIRLANHFSRKDLILFTVSILFVFLSQSRTSLFSVILGLLSIMIVNKELRNLVSKKILVFILLSGVFIVLNLETINNYIFGYLNKSNSESVGASIIDSRGTLFDNQIFNINNHPFFGIGFKTRSDLEIQENVFSTGKLYEKGNMVMASIEELGFIGFVLIMIMLITLLKIKANKKSNYLILAFVALFTTLGESTLFSIGGVGVLVWSFIFFNFHNGCLNVKSVNVQNDSINKNNSHF